MWKYVFCGYVFFVGPKPTNAKATEIQFKTSIENNHSVKRKTVKNSVKNLNFSALTKFEVPKKNLRTFQYSGESVNAGEGGGYSKRLWKWWEVVAVEIDLFDDKKYSIGNDILGKLKVLPQPPDWFQWIFVLPGLK